MPEDYPLTRRQRDIHDYLRQRETEGLPPPSLDERLLRVQVFNRAFAGFAYYYVTIEDDQPQADGLREVTAVASGRFLQISKRMKALFLIVDNQVIGGQVLEGVGLPPCLAPEESRTS